jgi:VWFA-related protein
MPTLMIRRTLLAAALIAGLLLPPGLPRAAAGQEAQQTLKVQANLVNLYATVRDKRHAIVADLKKEDFHIYEDGVEQKVEFFSREVSLPLTLGILLDTSGSVEQLLGAEQQTAGRFLERVMRKSDEAMLITFDLNADQLEDFTSDVSALERAINRARINTGGNVRVTPSTIPQTGPLGTVLYDAVYLACREKLSGEAGRKAIIILTDAEDNGSKVRLEEAIESAQRSDTVIHILLQSDPRFGFGGFGGGGAGVARKMTNETGGRTIEVRNEKDLQKAFDEISDELRSQYTLGYTPSNPAHDGKFRRIRVETARPDTKVLARQGYYAPRN